ncbi:glycosyltransferase family 9 protein [bacterium]|nr:glycosyltransferase family 9 protein [bacterium]
MSGPVIGILQLARFGDLIQTSPLIQRLRATHPDARLSLLVDARNAPVAKMLADIDEVLPLPVGQLPYDPHATLSDRFRALRDWLRPVLERDPFDTLITLNMDPFTGALAELLPARERRGPRPRRVVPAPHRYLAVATQDRTFNPIHLSEVWAAYTGFSGPVPEPQIQNYQLGTGFALDTRSSSLSSMKIKRFAVNLGAKAAGRRPPWEKLAEIVAGLLARSDAEIVLLGLPEDRDTASSLIQSLPDNQRDRITDLTGATAISDLPGVLSACDVLISSDTGTLQLAAATKTPCVGLFMAGANPVETGPYLNGAVAVVRRNTLEFNENQRDDLHGLPVQTIVRLASALADGDEPQRSLIDANNAFAVLVARPDDVGLCYAPLAGTERVPLGQGQRWTPYLRWLIHGEAALGTANVPNDAFLSDEQRGVLAKLMTNPGTAFPGEERWLGTIVQAFVGETAALLTETSSAVQQRMGIQA